jgi:ATP-dependent RNA helicase DOB1
MEAIFAWCKGVKFVEVQKLTGTFEGTTIRTLRRLEELVRHITVAAKAIGDRDLEVKFEEGSKLEILSFGIRCIYNRGHIDGRSCTVMMM